MMRPYIAGCAAGLLLLVVSCSQAPKPAPDTRAADEKNIRDSEASWANDWAAKDPDRIVSHYADDAVLMVPDAPVLNGKDTIRNTVKEMVGDKNFSLTFATAAAEVSKSGDLAYTQGAYTLTHTDPKTSRPVTETGKYVTVYKKQSDGSWKAVEDISSANTPVGAGPQPAKPGKAARKPKQKRAPRHR